ncbi:MAG: hypothetical protein KGL39_31235 [Patescibacteria group bacterium]|nr:hypothetical protein [Patescibacteria group bacterium]
MNTSFERDAQKDEWKTFAAFRLLCKDWVCKNAERAKKTCRRLTSIAPTKEQDAFFWIARNVYAAKNASLTPLIQSQETKGGGRIINAIKIQYLNAAAVIEGTIPPPYESKTRQEKPIQNIGERSSSGSKNGAEINAQLTRSLPSRTICETRFGQGCGRRAQKNTSRQWSFLGVPLLNSKNILNRFGQSECRGGIMENGTLTTLDLWPPLI